jgi:large subunit ribosomal protein L25
MLYLEAKIRKAKGRKVKSLLKEGKVLAVLYGPGIDNLNLEIEEKLLRKFLKEKNENSPISLKIEGKEYKVIIKEIQREPIKEKIIHIDFYKLPQK